MSRHIYPTPRAVLEVLDVRDLKVGADVRCEREERPRGSWSRYAGRVGRVASINIQTFPDGRAYVELGVRFTTSTSEPATFFRPYELERSYGAYKGPRSRAIAASAHRQRSRRCTTSRPGIAGPA